VEGWVPARLSALAFWMCLGWMEYGLVLFIHPRSYTVPHAAARPIQTTPRPCDVAAERLSSTLTLDRMTSRAMSRALQSMHPRRAARHRSALR